MTKEKLTYSNIFETLTDDVDKALMMKLKSDLQLRDRTIKELKAEIDYLRSSGSPLGQRIKELEFELDELYHSQAFNNWQGD